MRFKNKAYFNFVKAFLQRLLRDDISFLSGGVAFYGMLALFPAMAGLVSLFGLIASPKMVSAQLKAIQMLFPPNVYGILEEQLLQLVSQPDTTLSVTVIVSLILTIYSATKGTKAMLAALNLIFAVRETRSWLYQQIQSFALTFGGLIMMIMAVFIVVAVPIVMRLLPPGFGDGITSYLEWVQWLILAATVFGGLFLLFAFGPNRRFERNCVHSIFWGSFIATAIWIAASVGGSILVQLFPKINAAYGSLSAIIALMMWLYISSYTVLIGAIITAVAEEIECKSDKAATAPARA
ncbi:MAG: ribonuclease [Alphaproteobacteria bacterium]|nr:ribonuclease [Alphaproteobacteria bacterium]